MDRRTKIRILSGILLAGVVFSGCGIGAETGKSFTKKQVTTYDRDDTKKTELTCLFYADMPHIPFVDAEQYLDLVYCEDADYTLTGKGHLYSVVGKNKKTGKTGSALLIDTEKDTLTFENYNEFVVGKPDGTESPYVKMTDESGGEDPPLTYDLSKYDIDLVAGDGHVYMPLSTLSDILNKSLTYADFIDGNIYLNRSDAFTADPTEYVMDLEDTYFDTVTREADVAEYAYHEFCFILENLYGKPGRAASQEFVENISTIGLDETLKQGGIIGDVDLALMKEYLTSTNKAEYAQGLIMLDNLLYDGGHNQFSYSFYYLLKSDQAPGETAFARDYWELFKYDWSKNLVFVNLIRDIEIANELKEALTDLRDEGFGSPEKTWEGEYGDLVAALYLFDNTAVFQFDDFADDLILTGNGEKPFIEALDMAEEKNCENFVLDLSTNGGGSDQTMGYLLSMIYDQDAPFYRMDIDTGFHKKDVFTADKNLDGSFDEKDGEVRYDFHYAIMISDYSYSCGNAMPNLAHEKEIPLLGSATSGGGSNVAALTLPGECTPYRLSTTRIITNSSYQSVDPGIGPDIPMLTVTKDGAADASLYDPEQLVSAVNAYFKE